MKDFIEEFKIRARNRNATTQDFIARALFKAIKAKNSNKKEVFVGLLHKGFSAGAVKPHRPMPYWTLICALQSFKMSASKGRRWNGTKYAETPGRVFGYDITDFLEGEDVELWYEMLTPEFISEVCYDLRKDNQ